MKSEFLQKLLEGKKVEWRTLGELAILQRGRVMSKNYLTENKGIYPVYSSQTVNNGMIGKLTHLILMAHLLAGQLTELMLGRFFIVAESSQLQMFAV